MKNTIYKPIAPNVNLYKILFGGKDDKPYEVANEDGDILTLKFEDAFNMTVAGEEQRFYVMECCSPGDEGESGIFQLIADGGAAALLKITDEKLEVEVMCKYLQRLADILFGGN